MNKLIPSIDDVRARLSQLKDGEINEISRRSGVPVSTLWKIRCGATPNPGIETVRKFFDALPPSESCVPDPAAEGQGVANA